jgi:hypothetical protein
MAKNLPNPILRDVKSPGGPDFQVVPAPQTESTLSGSVQTRAERDSLLWILRIVRREVAWSEDSPTLRMIDAALARS